MRGYFKLYVNRVLEKVKFLVVFLISIFLERVVCYLMKDFREDILSKFEVICLYCLCSEFEVLFSLIF